MKCASATVGKRNAKISTEKCENKWNNSPLKFAQLGRYL